MYLNGFLKKICIYLYVYDKLIYKENKIWNNLFDLFIMIILFLSLIWYVLNDKKINENWKIMII